MKNQNKNRIAAYLRVSTDEQRDAGTIATQRNSIRDFCNYKKLTIDAYFEDEAVSGALPMWERPQGVALWQEIENKQIDKLLVYKIDRLGRRIKYVLDFTDHCTINGVTILSIEDNNLDLSSPTGRLMLSILAAFAENERDVFRERSLAGKRRKAESGKVLSHAPYGYSITKNYDLELDPVRAPIVKLIFERYVAGDSARQIITQLEAENAPLPLRGGKKWRFDSLLNYMRNPAYYGEYHNFRSPEIRDGKRIGARDPEKIIVIPCPPIISKSLWDQAQQTIKLNRMLGPKSSTRFYLLRGLIRCQKCGLTYTGHTVNPRSRLNKKGELITYSKHSYYDCASKHSRDYEFCKSPAVRQDDLETAIWNDIEEFVRNPETVIEQMLKQQRALSKSSNTIQSDISKIEKKLAKIGQQKTKIILASGKDFSHQDAAPAIEQLNLDIDSLSARKHKLESELKSESADGGRQQITNAREMIQALNERLDKDISNEEKSSIIRALVKEITVSLKVVEGKNRADVEISYYFEKKIKQNYFSSVASTFKLSSRKNINARPRRLLLPDFVLKLMRPPEARPYSAEN